MSKSYKEITEVCAYYSSSNLADKTDKTKIKLPVHSSYWNTPSCTPPPTHKHMCI